MLLRRVIDHIRAQNWTAVALDLVIVIAGVYIGIYLGNVRGAQKFAIEARQSLEALKLEMRSDLQRLDEVIAFQTAKTDAQHQLIGLLGAENIDQGEVGRLIEMTITDNDTFFPSRSAYEAMKTGGYLAALPDADLRVALSRLFERDYVRQDHNGLYYDQRASEVGNTIIAQCWDRLRWTFMSCGEDSAAVIRNGIMSISAQGDFYLGLITETIRPEIVRTLAMIDTFQGKSAS